MMKQFKVVVIGDGGVGKSSLVKRTLTGDFTETYHPTPRAEVWSHIFQTSDGPVQINFSDTCGQEKAGSGLSTSYYKGADAAIIMYDVTSRTTYTHCSGWDKAFRSACGTDLEKYPPMVCIGNKIDEPLADQKVRTVGKTAFSRNRVNWCHFNISIKTQENIDFPIVWLLRKLTKNKNLNLLSTYVDPTPHIEEEK